MSYLPNVREAVRHVDETAVARVTRYHLWAIFGSTAILAAASFYPDRILSVASPYLPILESHIPGFKALPDVMTGVYCLPQLAAARLAFGMFLVFIPLSWLIYLLRVGPRYLKAVRKVAESVVQPGDLASNSILVDFGWNRERYRYPDLTVVGSYLFVTLAVLGDSLWFPHLARLGCTGSVGGIVWLALEVLFGGLLAVLAPHAVILMRQAAVLRRGRRP